MEQHRPAAYVSSSFAFKKIYLRKKEMLYLFIFSLSSLFSISMAPVCLIPQTSWTELLPLSLFSLNFITRPKAMIRTKAETPQITRSNTVLSGWGHSYRVRNTDRQWRHLLLRVTEVCISLFLILKVNECCCSFIFRNCKMLFSSLWLMS